MKLYKLNYIKHLNHTEIIQHLPQVLINLSCPYHTSHIQFQESKYSVYNFQNSLVVPETKRIHVKKIDIAKIVSKKE